MLILSIILAILVLAFFIGTYIIYRIGFYSKHEGIKDPFDLPDFPAMKPFEARTLELMKELHARPFESVEITSFDGLKLYGRYYHIKDGAPVDIGFHGWHAYYLRDFCGGSKLCFDMGHNFLLIDQRGQGLSGSNTMTFGVKEKYDAVSWCNYIVERFGKDVEINLYGISMGAATVLQAAAQPLPPNVKHIIADCPYSAPVRIIQYVTKNGMHLPPKFFHPFDVAAARIYGHFNLTDKTSDAVETVKNCKIPILIIHGEADDFVPEWMSKEIADANPNIKRYTFPNAEHGLSYMHDEERYRKLVQDFMQN